MRVCWPYLLKKNRCRQGFSLVELSIVVAIISVVATLGLEAAANFVNRTSTSVTRDKLVTIDDAIARFFKIYGRLPCPAKRDDWLLNSSTSFGAEDCTISVWSSTSIGGGLMAGMVPFKTLDLPMSTAVDGFNNRINYVATKNLTVAGTGANTFGDTTNGVAGIEIRTGRLEQPCDNLATNCQKLADPTATSGAAYVIFSNGADQRGAVSLFSLPPYTPAIACPNANPNNQHVDAMNCQWGASPNTTSVTAIPANVFYDNRYNAGLNPTSYFDDVILWRTKAQL